MLTELGAALRAARLAHGWTLRAAERRSGVANAHIFQIETGAIREPQRRTLQSLAAAYGIPLAGLLTLMTPQAQARDGSRPGTEVPPWVAQLREEVRERLSERCATQQALAACLGVTPQYLGQVLAGASVPSAEFAARLAEAMGLRIVIVTVGEPVPLARDRRGWPRGKKRAAGRGTEAGR